MLFIFFSFFFLVVLLAGGTASWFLFVSVFLSVVSRLSGLFLDRPDLQRLSGAKRSARDADLSRPLHHCLICVTIARRALSVSGDAENTVRLLLSCAIKHKSCLARTNTIKKLFLFWCRNTLVHFTSLAALKAVLSGNNNNESC